MIMLFLGETVVKGTIGAADEQNYVIIPESRRRDPSSKACWRPLYRVKSLQSRLRNIVP